MPRQRVDLINGESYHICHRAVGDSLIFLDQDDYYRGIFSLYEFNNTQPTEIWLRRKQRKAEKRLALGSPIPHQSEIVPERDKFVDVLAFCFMPNHIHLLLRQLKDGGISKFMKKTGGGYANFFNKKYWRKGHLFNQFKAIHIKDDNQLRNVITYIHCNPISLVEPGWKDGGISNPERVVDFLENEYRWSSLWDYKDKPNFQSVTSRDFLLGLVGKENMKQEMNSWITYKTELKKAMDMHDALFLE